MSLARHLEPLVKSQFIGKTSAHPATPTHTQPQSSSVASFHALTQGEAGNAAEAIPVLQGGGGGLHEPFPISQCTYPGGPFTQSREAAVEGSLAGLRHGKESQMWPPLYLPLPLFSHVIPSLLGHPLSHTLLV